MAQIQTSKMECEVDLKASSERYFHAYFNKQSLWPKICPNIIKDMNFIKGHSLSLGSVIKWTFAPIGNSPPETCTVVVEASDERNKTVAFRAIDGGLTKLYSHYKFTVKIMDSSNGNGSFLRSALEYRKIDADVPDPIAYVEVGTVLLRIIDAYLVGHC